MIVIERNGTEVVLRFWLAIPTWETRIFPLSFNCGPDGTAYAGLLAEKMQQKLGDRMANARREAYEQGWADAKAKRAKCDWFSRKA